MATRYGTQTNKALVQSTPGYSLGLKDESYQGKIRVISDVYTLTGDLSVNDVIIMGVIPEGARVVECKLVCTALSAGNLDVGWQAAVAPLFPPAATLEAANQNGFLAAVAVTSASSTSLVGLSTASAAAGFNKVFAATCNLVVTVQTDTSATTGSIYVELHYLVD